MERLVERLEKAVQRLETVCQGPGMCGDGSSQGKAPRGCCTGGVRKCSGAAAATGEENFLQVQRFPCCAHCASGGVLVPTW